MDPALTKYSGLGAGASLPYYSRQRNGNFIPYGELPPYYSRLEQGSFIPYGDYVFKPVTSNEHIGMAGYGANGNTGCGFWTIVTAAAVGFWMGYFAGQQPERKIWLSKIAGVTQVPSVSP
jgi:hypothetical protein